VTPSRGFALLLLAFAGCSSPTSTPTAPGAQTAAAAPVEKAFEGLPEIAADPREAILAEAVTAMLTREHLRHHPIDDEVSKAAFPVYLEGLDGQKLFLLKEHVTALGRYRDRMDDQMRDGNLALARKGAGLMVVRQKLVGALIAERLGRPFDFTKQEQLETDAEKLTFATTEDELHDRWRKVLKLQVLERVGRMERTEEALKSAKTKKPAEPKKPEDVAAAAKALAEIPKTFEAKEKKAREDLTTGYSARFTRLADLDPLQPTEAFLNAIATVYDPHTQYMPPAEKENFDIAMTGSLQGIGAALGEEDHYIMVRELVPGGASWKQGELEAGDLILSVAQHHEKAVGVADMPIDKVVKMIRGPKGTIVKLTVKKADGSIEAISITRDVIEIEASYARGAILDLGEKHEPQGYIYLPSFYDNASAGGRAVKARNATADIHALLKIFQDKKIGGVVVDLRGNGGGLLDHARDITGLLVKQGPVVQTRTSAGELEVLTDRNPLIAFDGELIVLVDRFSASASEILAGALQDYHRALIVGTGPTHGKGTVQIVVDLDRMRSGAPGDPLGVLKLTVQQYFRINGESTQWRGVVPDVVLPDPAAYVESGERFMDHSIPWSEVRPVEFQMDDRRGNTEVLAANARRRIAQEPAFEKIELRSKLLKARREKTLEPLERKAWLAKRDEEKAALDAVDPKLSEGKARFEVVVVGRESGNADKAAKERIDRWQKGLGHDPWLEEALHLLDDMAATAKSAAKSAAK